MKRIITATLLWTALCAGVFAQNESDFKFDGKGTVTGYDGWDTAVVIPAQIGGVPVTAIGNRAFRNMGLTAVTLPASITSIGSEAFTGNKLTTVTIPAGVTIGSQAFENNTLTSVTVGSGASIADNAFRRNSLRTLTLGDNVHFLEEGFNSVSVWYEYMCNNRRAGTYDATVTHTAKTEGDYQFVETKNGAVIIRYNGNEGSRLQIPGRLGGVAVKGINARGSGSSITGAFEGKSVSRMQLPDGITFIGYGAFYRNQLTSVTIPDSVIYIGDGAFANNRLDSVTIPDSVTYIGKSTFRDNQLTGVIIGNSVTSIGNEAFNSNQLTGVTIPDSVTSIGDSAFSSNQLTSFIIGNGVISIGQNVFSSNRGGGMTLTIPDSVTSSRSNTFSGVTSVIFTGSGLATQVVSNISTDTNLPTVYASGGAGTYTRPNSRSESWTKEQ